MAARSCLRIEVTDADPRPPQPRAPAELDESGFGLVLVDSLASSWGVNYAAAGKTVWIELALSENNKPERRLNRNPARATDIRPPVIVQSVAASAAQTSEVVEEDRFLVLRQYAAVQIAGGQADVMVRLSDLFSAPKVLVRRRIEIAVKLPKQAH